MKAHSCYLAALSAGLATASPVWFNQSSNALTAQTTSGVISGFVDPKFPFVRQFLGIPYAQPPTGASRFAAPQRLVTPDAPRNGSRVPFACPQVPATAAGANVFTVSAPQFDNAAPWDEDCLSVSVFAPSNPRSNEQLPVFVWIHGGGLVSGSSSVAYQQPPAWIQRTQEHIVVAIQYRLDIFGFPNAAGLNQTNLGLLDQRMALEWARDNVGAFGGDINRMVLWGQSSGAGSVDAQNFAYPDDPIVSGFISDSGSAFFPPGTGLTTFDPTHSNFSTVARGLGCPSSPAAEVACMRNQSAAAIIGFRTNYTAARTMPALNFVATPDERVVFANYTARYAAGRLSSQPAIFGSNANEGVVMVPFPTADPAVNAPSDAELQMAEAFTQEIYHCPAYTSALERHTAGRKTYQYVYAGNFSDVSPLFWEGAYHMSELPQIFGTRGQFRAEPSAFEVQTSEAMQDLWLGFAKDPENADKAGWAEFGSGNLLMLGDAQGENPVQQLTSAQFNHPCM